MLNLAHTFGTGGPDVELLLLAVALLFLGVTFFIQKTTKPAVPVVLLVAALGVGGGAFAVGAATGSGDGNGTLQAPGELAVSIVSPSEGSTVPARETLDLVVNVVGGELTSATESEDPTQGHLHIFVDGTLTSMPTTTTQKIRLEPGEHTLGVEFTTADHRSFEPRIMDEVAVTAQ